MYTCFVMMTNEFVLVCVKVGGKIPVGCLSILQRNTQWNFVSNTVNTNKAVPIMLEQSPTLPYVAASISVQCSWIIQNMKFLYDLCGESREEVQWTRYPHQRIIQHYMISINGNNSVLKWS